MMKKFLMVSIISTFYVSTVQSAECLSRDCSNGYGIYQFEKGGHYFGYWKNNKMHGQGIFLLTNGNKYVGDFKKGQYNGKGLYLNSNGDKYSGEFKNNRFNGQGTYFFSDGKKMMGIWSNDRLIKAEKGSVNTGLVKKSYI
ncbi:MAG: hypothetical protein HON94_00150 [Methylococcales bacterium]|jgi:hypothetical protein|nr:hypothetical protein [Methylococcales bacterium]MBT7410823.1 hypothetical protein [Methylococcales bacterium]